MYCTFFSVLVKLDSVIAQLLFQLHFFCALIGKPILIFGFTGNITTNPHPLNAKRSPYSIGYIVFFDFARYTEWIRLSKNESSLPLPNELVANELYDLEKDPDETENVVEKQKFADKVEELSEMLWEKVNNRI